MANKREDQLKSLQNQINLLSEAILKLTETKVKKEKGADSKKTKVKPVKLAKTKVKKTKVKSSKLIDRPIQDLKELEDEEPIIKVEAKPIDEDNKIYSRTSSLIQSNWKNKFVDDGKSFLADKEWDKKRKLPFSPRERPVVKNVKAECFICHRVKTVSSSLIVGKADTSDDEMPRYRCDKCCGGR